MEISHASDDIHFRAPSEPAPRIDKGSKRQNTNTITRGDCRGKGWAAIGGESTKQATQVCKVFCGS